MYDAQVGSLVHCAAVRKFLHLLIDNLDFPFELLKPKYSFYCEVLDTEVSHVMFF